MCSLVRLYIFCFSVLPKYEVTIEMGRSFHALEFGDITGNIMAKYVSIFKNLSVVALQTSFLRLGYSIDLYSYMVGFAYFVCIDNTSTKIIYLCDFSLCMFSRVNIIEAF